MKRSLSVAIALGIALGVAFPALALGVGATHVICTKGPVIGWSGALATPDMVSIAPPGGSVNSSYSVPGGSGYSAIPQNSSSAFFDVYNWTLNSTISSVALGWGSNAPCPGDSLGTGPVGGNVPWSGCGGCAVAAPAPSGVGQRLIIPQQVFYGSLPSALMNATYGMTPNASVTWNESGGGVTWTNSTGLSGLPVTFAPFYEYGALYGFAITLKQSGIHFGIPIHLITGGVENIAASFPQDLQRSSPGGVYLSITMTYVFPATTAQGTWAIYRAGAGSPFSVGGLLFEQTAGPS